MAGAYSSRTKKIKLALSQKRNESDDSDKDIDSEDSYVLNESGLEVSEPEYDTDSETDVYNEEDQESIGHSGEMHISQSSHQTGIGVTSPKENEEEREYRCKGNCFLWHSKPVITASQSTRRKVQISQPDGPARALGITPTPRQIWDLLITSNIVEEIVKNTNIKLETMRLGIQNQSSTAYKETDSDEINALLGIFLLCSILKSSTESLASLWSTSITGRPIFRAFMTEKRCTVLLRALRFDDSSTRKERENQDRAAAISNIFQMFIENCQKNYSIGAHTSIGETLVPFRGRCGFKIYMPNKPAKYGVKIMSLTDAHNAYLYNAYIYSGKGSDGNTLTPQEKTFTKPTQSVLRLSKCIWGTNRNITCDDWFTSLELASELLKNELTVVGTLKKTTPQIPPAFISHKNKKEGSSIYGYTKEFTLLSYVSKPRKAVVLLSSMNHSEFSDIQSRKPALITFYNFTRSGLDTLDQKCSIYSVHRKTRRWPLAIFYFILAAATSNGHTLLGLYPGAADSKMSRFDFVKEVALSLANNYLKKRLLTPNLSKELKNIISEAAQVTQVEPSLSTNILTDRLEKKRNCRYCPYERNRMTAYKCINCDTPTCLEHSKKICDECVK